MLAKVDDRNFDGSHCIELETVGVIIVTQGEKLIIYDSGTFECLDTITIDLPKSKTREPERIVGMRKSEDE